MGSQMTEFISLKEVSASMLPAAVLVLLSQYSLAVRKHTGLVIKISSANVFLHIHNTNKLTDHPEVRRLHQELLGAVTRHISAGTMQTIQQRYRSVPAELLKQQLTAS